jgi:hypothetical protein
MASAHGKTAAGGQQKLAFVDRDAAQAAIEMPANIQRARLDQQILSVRAGVRQQRDLAGTTSIRRLVHRQGPEGGDARKGNLLVPQAVEAQAAARGRVHLRRVGGHVEIPLQVMGDQTVFTGFREHGLRWSRSAGPYSPRTRQEEKAIHSADAPGHGRRTRRR